jgi:SsrA-binding protein
VKRGPAADAGPRAFRLVAENRQARFRYELLDRYEAGLVLTGSEVKSIRAAQVTLTDAHVAFRRSEAFLLGCHVAPYSHAAVDAHDPDRPRKLLLKKAEIEKLDRAVAQKGLTVVPTKIYFSGSRVKVEIALARGKNAGDKRETIKKRDLDRAARRGED